MQRKAVLKRCQIISIHRLLGVMGDFQLTSPSNRRIIGVMSVPTVPIKSGSFRKLLVIVKAYRFRGTAPKLIKTLEGPMTAMPGDWIITGVEGEKYSCKDEIFRQTYEPVGKTKTARNAFRVLG
jgi:hypothetical protein